MVAMEGRRMRGEGQTPAGRPQYRRSAPETAVHPALRLRFARSRKRILREGAVPPGRKHAMGRERLRADGGTAPRAR